MDKRYNKNNKFMQIPSQNIIDTYVEYHPHKYPNHSQYNFQGTINQSMSKMKSTLFQYVEAGLIEEFYAQIIIKYSSNLKMHQLISFMQIQIELIKSQQCNYNKITQIINSRKNCIATLKDLINSGQLNQKNKYVLQQCCKCISHLRIITVILIEAIERWRYQLVSLQNRVEFQKRLSQKKYPIIFYFQNKNILQTINMDTLFLNTTILRRYITLSKSSDPLFLFPLKQLKQNEFSNQMKNYNAVWKLFDISSKLKTRLENSDQILKNQKNIRSITKRDFIKPHSLNAEGSPLTQIRQIKQIRRKTNKYETEMQLNKTNYLNSKQMSERTDKLKTQIMDTHNNKIEEINRSLLLTRNNLDFQNQNAILNSYANYNKNRNYSAWEQRNNYIRRHSNKKNMNVKYILKKSFDKKQQVNFQTLKEQQKQQIPKYVEQTIQTDDFYQPYPTNKKKNQYEEIMKQIIKSKNQQQLRDSFCNLSKTNKIITEYSQPVELLGRELRPIVKIVQRRKLKTQMKSRDTQNETKQIIEQVPQNIANRNPSTKLILKQQNINPLILQKQSTNKTLDNIKIIQLNTQINFQPQKSNELIQKQQFLTKQLITLDYSANKLQKDQPLLVVTNNKIHSQNIKTQNTNKIQIVQQEKQKKIVNNINDESIKNMKGTIQSNKQSPNKIKNKYIVSSFDISIKKFNKFFGDCKQLFSQNQLDYINGNIISRHYRHFYFHEVKLNNKVNAIAISSIKIQSSLRNIYIHFFKLIQSQNLQSPEKLLKCYINYLFIHDPCHHLYLINHHEYIEQLFLKSEFNQISQNRTVNKNVKILQTLRKKQNKIELQQLNTFQLKHSMILIHKQDKKIFYSNQIQPFSHQNCYTQFLKTKLLKYYINSHQDLQINLKTHITTSFQSNVQTPCLSFQNIPKLNQYLANHSYQIYQTMFNIQDIYIGFIEIFNSFKLDYLVNGTSMIFQTNNQNAFYGENQSFQYVMLQLQGYQSCYLLFIKQSGKKLGENAMSRFEKSLGYLIDFKKQKMKRTIKIPFFRKQIYGKIISLQNKWDIFGNVIISMYWKDYVTGVKIFEDEGKTFNLKQNFLFGIVQKRQKNLNTLFITQITKKDLI